jgi:hypothetical protein
LNPEGTAQVQTRIQLANTQKSFQKALVLDKEDDWEARTLSFTGVAETLEGIRSQLAADLRIPKAKLFGDSASGFSSGEDVLETYNGMIESTIRSKSKKDILRILQLRCQQLFGFVPDDLTFEFHPLRVLSDEQQQTVRTAKYNNLLAARQAGEITAKEFRDACNKENLLGFQLQTDDLEDEDDAGQEVSTDPEDAE